MRRVAATWPSQVDGQKQNNFQIGSRGQGFLGREAPQKPEGPALSGVEGRHDVASPKGRGLKEHNKNFSPPKTY